MFKVGILSDTHGSLPEGLLAFFGQCDEVWHAGDWGDPTIADRLGEFKILRGVYGNIDGPEIRSRFPLINTFQVENLKVCMTHIGGYPGKYWPDFLKQLRQIRPGLVICGHSHILKVMRDPDEQWMFMNPGAAGQEGFHKVRTALRFNISGTIMSDLEVWESKK